MVQGTLHPHLLVLGFSQWCLVYSWIVASWSPCEGYCVGDHLCRHVNDVTYGCLLLVELTHFPLEIFRVYITFCLEVLSYADLT